MELSDSEIELIEKHLDGSLSESEEKLFNKKLSSSETFSRQVSIADLTLNNLKNSYEDDLRKEIKSIYEDAKSEGLKPANNEKVNSSKFYWVSGLAASLLIFFIIWFTIPGKLSNEDLFTSYYVKYPSDPIIRGDHTTDLNSTMKLYDQNKFEEAVLNFEKHLTQNPGNYRVHLFLGNSYLNTGQFEKAIENFNNALNSQDSLIRQSSEWYLALSYLKINEKSKSIKILENITTNSHDHIYLNESLKLLKDIRKR